MQSKIETQQGDIQGIEKHFEEGVVTEFLGASFARFTSKYTRFIPPSESRKPEWKKTIFAKTKAVS